MYTQEDKLGNYVSINYLVIMKKQMINAYYILSLCNFLFLCTSTYLPFCISSTTSEMFLINLIKVRHFVHIGVITTKQICVNVMYRYIS